MYFIGGMGWYSNETMHRVETLLGGWLGLRCWWRVWQATECSGKTHVVFELEIPECDFSIKSVRMGNAGNWNILVPAGKKINWDSVSKSDWKQNKANWILVRNDKEMWCIDHLLSYLGNSKSSGKKHVKVWKSRRGNWEGFWWYLDYRLLDIRREYGRHQFPTLNTS